MLPQPIVKAVAEESFFRQVSDLKSLFDQGFTYPNRPLSTNTFLSYKLHQVLNPGSFFVEFTDMASVDIKTSMENALYGFKKALVRLQIGHAELNDLWEQMPIVVADRDFTQYFRAEVNVVNSETGDVNVTLVDTGAEACVKVEYLFLPSVDLIRYPKLALLCRLSQVVSIQGNWLEMDYAPYLQGRESSLVVVCPRDSVKGVVNVYLECDKVDVGLKLIMRLGCADMTPLPYVPKAEFPYTGEYPIYDFTDWVGIVLPVYGLHVFTASEVVLQLDCQRVNQTLDFISNYVASTPNAKTLPFKKENGSPCLALHATGYYHRATIHHRVQNGCFLVKFVDFYEFAIIPESNLIKIPEEGKKHPEGATLCRLVDVHFANLDPSVIEPQLKELLVFKDLYCRIDDAHFGFDPNQPTVGVRLSQPVGDDGNESSFADIMKLGKYPVEQGFIYLKSNSIVSSEVADRLLNGPSYFFPDTKYTGGLSCAENEQSVWLQLGDNGVKAEVLAEEMTRFYKVWNGPVMTPEMINIEAYIVCRQQDDPRWYRAKVISFDEKSNLYHVLFLDYGNFDHVSLKSMKPLVNYFARDKCLALQVALPVVLKTEVDLDVLSDFMLTFCEGEDLNVWLQHKDHYNYAWIVKNGMSLADALKKQGFVSELMFNPASNLGA